MPPKPILVNQTSARKSVTITPSRVEHGKNFLNCEETEIVAQISVPEEGCRGWVVVATSFLCFFIMDGICFTFGSLIEDIRDDLEISESLIPLMNSITVAMYYMVGPLISALVNRFGFRACIMAGSVICYFAYLVSFFLQSFITLCIFYGAIAGFGFCLINLSASLIVGFYFEKLRALALSISTCGSSFGIMTMFPLNTYLVKLGGWRTTILLHSGLFGIIFFIGMSFRPLASLSAIKTGDDPTRTVTFLPSLLASAAKIPLASPSSAKTARNIATGSERFFNAISNVNFPTAAAVLEEKIILPGSEPGPSTATTSKLTLVTHGGFSKHQLKQVHSIMSRVDPQDNQRDKSVDITIQLQQPTKPTKRSCWARLCHWEPHIPQSRPLYRDDAFYTGKLEKLPIYRKSMIDTPDTIKTGLEYQLAVSRAVAASDLNEHRGICTTAVRRVLASMMDPKLLRKLSFLLLCLSGTLIYSGLLVPYVYISDRNLSAGVTPFHCTLFVSAIGLANVAGRLILGGIALKVDALSLLSFSLLVSGISTIISDLSYDLYYQYAYCGLFGLFISGPVCLRTIVLVDLYGLEKLTNATGMLLLFLGIGSLISTPLAGILKSNFGYSISFYVAGSLITLSGFVLIIVKVVSLKDAKKNKKDVKTRNIKK